MSSATTKMNAMLFGAPRFVVVVHFFVLHKVDQLRKSLGGALDHDGGGAARVVRRKRGVAAAGGPSGLER